MTVPYDPEHITYFAETDYRNQRQRFGIKSRDRTRHMYVIGKSGVGKSTLLENMAIQDIAHGDGVAVLDPHGSFAEKMLEYIPMHRIKDVIYFAPFDSNYPISFNVLEDVGADKRHFVASGLMSTFKKIWVDAWSARMEYILNNILLALLEYPNSTLLGVNRMLSDKVYRTKVVNNITDPGVKAFWVEEFAKYGDRYMQEAGAAIQNKIGQLTANPLIRNIIGQPKSSFSVRDIMDNQKILIINLSKGRIGEQNTSLIGSMIITKIYLGAMSRAEVPAQQMAQLSNFYFYVDEFQSFANETFADILAEARKYKLALIIAHQYVAQMEEKVRDAVFGNVGTTISFRVGPLDAELLERVMAPQFTQNDLINLGMAQIYLTLMINDIGSSPFSAKTLPPLSRPDISYRNDVIEYTRETFASPKEAVEKAIKEWYDDGVVSPQSKEDHTAKQPFRSQDGQEKKHQPFKKVFEQQNTPATHTDTAFVKKDRKEYEGVKKQQPHQPSQQPLRQPAHQPAQPSVGVPPVQQKQFQKNNTSIQESSISKPEKQQQKTEVSDTLRSLLDALDSTPVAVVKNDDQKVSTPTNSDTVTAAPKEQGEDKTSAEKKSTHNTPFAGEKPLREQIPPVKFAERGPSQKNKALLAEALQKAVSQRPTPQTPASQQPRQTPLATDTSQSKEIDYQTLKKILE